MHEQTSVRFALEWLRDNQGFWTPHSTITSELEAKSTVKELRAAGHGMRATKITAVITREEMDW